MFGKIMDLLNSGKKCATCGVFAPFRVMIGYDVDKRTLDDKRHKAFCRVHGIEEWKRLLDGYKGALVVFEPGEDAVSGSFFYEPEDLKVHAYPDENRQKVEALLAKVPHAADAGILFLEEADAYIDLFSSARELKINESAKIVFLSKSELINRMSEKLRAIEQKFTRGEFWVTEPRGGKGVYVWDPDV